MLDAEAPAGIASRAFRVGGVVPFSTTDWPGRLAAVVFAQGCPWRCTYCHNAHLQGVEGEDPRDFGRILDWLRSRKGLIDGVVFSGGEPTAQPALGVALQDVRELGFATGLHTGGMYPRRFPEVVGRLDWVGLDIKAPQFEYEAITGVPRSGLAPFVTLALLRQSGVAHEVRTTVHPALTPPDRLERLAKELATCGVDRWVLQPFRAAGCKEALAVRTAPQGATIDDALVERLRRFVPGTVARAG